MSPTEASKNDGVNRRRKIKKIAKKGEKFCGTTIRIKKYLFNLIVKISEGNKRTLDIFGIKFTYKKGK